jgi:hypothetical protein
MKGLGMGWFREAEQKTESAALRPARLEGQTIKLF